MFGGMIEISNVVYRIAYHSIIYHTTRTLNTPTAQHSSVKYRETDEGECSGISMVEVKIRPIVYIIYNNKVYPHNIFDTL